MVVARRTDQTLNTIADDLRIGYSTLQRWIRLAKKNKLEKPESGESLFLRKLVLGIPAQASGISVS
jgi:transposase-like protein